MTILPELEPPLLNAAVYDEDDEELDILKSR
jgi:hypothetical protein